HHRLGIPRGDRSLASSVSDAPHDALQRLERRVEVLEQMMRRLVAPGAAAERISAAPEPAAVASPPAPRSRPPERPHYSPPTATAPDLEQWFGQRGLLFVGVLALLTAVGFFLKYAIDRGWIAPLVRALFAVAGGIGLAAWGEARIRAGLRRYGAAMIGAGGGLAYLGLWAAAGPYGLLERRIGVLLLAACTVVVTLLALRHEIEGLAIWALAGAYLAPVLLAPPTHNPEAFLGYLEVIGLGTGLLAYTMNWRRAFDLALAGYFLLAAGGAARVLTSALGCWFLAAGALLTLHVTRRRAWPEARVGMLALAWVLLGVALADVSAGPQPRLWLAVGAAFAIAALLWWQQLDLNRLRAPDEALLFLANPFVLLGLAAIADPKLLDRAPALFPALLAAVYLGVGWVRRATPHLVMGFALGAWAMAVDWSAPMVVVGWTALALAALASEQLGGRPGGRLAALGLALLAFPYLFGFALWDRPSDAATFTDPWALALYAYVAGTALAARRWNAGVKDPSTARWTVRGAELLWALCGAAVFAGGSVELQRYFGRRARLAGDLALSVFWLAYAGALVRLGFQLDRKDVRSAGLTVAAGAGLKIVLYDLSNLEALYRIASFFALALIALAVAYAYNKRAKASAM
ncbi:MAG TPA: DUF2339 domain-containing protein, partial [Gemmatimonadales bacterium]|nr:DUF2339 domain-containing protein [Gemmatimonadales bacterium]